MITLYLMNKKGLGVLEAVIENFGGEIISYAVVGTDKQTEEDYSEEIKATCKKHGVAYVDRQTVLEFDGYAFAIGWRWMIKNTPKLIVLHDSLLPKYRGFAPLVNALINEDKKVGVTALFASDEYDKGDIILQKSIDLEYPIKLEQAIDKISLLYGEAVCEIVSKIKRQEVIQSRQQDEAQATYSLWRDEEDYQVDWSRDSGFIKRFIDSVSFPYKGGASFVNGQKLRILDAEIFDDVEIINRDAGKIIFVKDGRPVVVCGSGLLQINKIVDDESKQEIFPWKSFRVRFK